MASTGDQETYTKMCQQLHKLGCWDPHMITHSVMCGHRDPRLPKSGKLECKNPEDLQGLYEAIDHFHQVGDKNKSFLGGTGGR